MFEKRSRQKEYLDESEIPNAALLQNLEELDVINRYLGGYAITLNALKCTLKPNKRYVLVDIGCGGGDSLQQIDKWARKNNHLISLYGVDIKPICIGYAKAKNQNSNIEFICDDYRNCNKHIHTIDIIHASLFCHHLTEEEIIELIQFANKNSIILVINDLERNPIAYYAIKFLTTILSKSYLVKNDAPLSVLRGFKKKEWEELIRKAGVQNYTVKHKWAFRHAVTIYPNNL